MVESVKGGVRVEGSEYLKNGILAFIVEVAVTRL
jgi:hypothetical protein